MNSKHILIVEDERAIREMIAFGLRRKGFEVGEAADAVEARMWISKQKPDLVLIDWMLPQTNGLELARSLKADGETQEIPIIMLTARSEEHDRVTALDIGADDYVTKPFSPRELLARINAVLRRATSMQCAEVVNAGGLFLDDDGHQVTASAETVQLGPTEYRLLSFFVTHPERVYSRTQLLDQVWGTNTFVGERTVDVLIRRLRKALEPSQHDRFIQTVRGSGYRFSTRPD